MKKFSLSRKNGIIEMTWQNNAVDSRAYRRLYHWVRRSTDYSSLGAKGIMDLKHFINETNAMFHSNMTLDEAISARHIIIKDKIVKRYNLMNRQIDTIAKKYDRGENILRLSTMYDFPPLNLLRGILLHKGMEPNMLYSVFAEKQDPQDLLPAKDLKQFYLARKNDAENTIDQQRNADVAAKNEKIVVNFFKKMGVSLRTQDELAEEQVREHGRAIITPDLLFLDEVYINGLRVHWIDYKDYIGTDVKFIYSSNVSQAARYNEKWGHGALCFGTSFVEGLTVPGAMLLDARSLPLKLIK